MYKDFVSDEPLEIIRINEAESGWLDSLTTKRVRRLFNELDSLREFKRSVDEALNSGDGSYRP